jgi:hypothetical protein
MSMFDCYKPAPELRCPVCQRFLGEWQGKDGPCGLLVWTEGLAAPIGQAVSEDLRLDEADLQRKRLPAEFVIYSYDCPEHYPVEADCQAYDGVWRSTKVRAYLARDR